MGVRRFIWTLAAALTLFTVGAGRVTAQSGDDASRAEARKIGYAGVEAFQAGDFATAHDRLETAYQLLKVPSLGLWSARALAKLGKLVEADARYLEVIKLPTSVGDEAIQQQARQDAASERGALARRIPSITVRVQGAPIGEVAVTIDDVALIGSALGENHLVNPGHHRVEGIRGATRAQADVTVAEGEQKDATLSFVPGAVADSGAATTPEAGLRAQPGAASGGGTMRTLGWVGVAAGGTGLAVGVVTALIVRSKKSHLDSVCPDGEKNCPASEQGNVDSFNSWRPIPTISLVAGALLAGAGAYLLLTTPATSEPGAGGATSASRRRPLLDNLRFAIGPGGTVLSGEF